MSTKFLTQKERDRILELSKSGIPQKDIAREVGRSTGAVSHVVNAERKGIQVKTYGGPHELPRYKEADLQALPDNILFHHTHYAIP